MGPIQSERICKRQLNLAQMAGFVIKQEENLVEKGDTIKQSFVPECL